MRIPNGEHAVVDIAKIRDYCLSRTHPRGRHKARVFESVLGLRREQSDILRIALLQAAEWEEAVPATRDEYGERYTVDFAMSGPKGNAVIRSLWIVRRGEDYPRLVTCHVL